MSKSVDELAGVDLSRHGRTLLSATLGLTLLVAYALLELRLPRGTAEFVYWPALEPLPFAPMRGFTFEQLARHVARLVVMGAALLLLTKALAAVRELRPPSAWEVKRWALAVSIVSLLLSAVVMVGVLRGRALFDDELTYAYQAQLLAEGRLGEKTVPAWGWELFTIWTQQGATGKYLFGEPVMQIIGRALGLPALLHLVLAAITLWVWYQVVRCDTGEKVAAWATLLLAASPMLILTTATGLSQPTSLTCVVLAGLGHQWARGDRPVAGSLLVGTCLGFGLSVRMQVALAAAVVLGGATAVSLIRRRRAGALTALLLSGSLWVAIVALYNKALTGSYRTLPWFLFHPSERYGFGRVLEGNPFVHTPWTAMENLLVTVVRFNGWWLGWPLSLGLIGAWLTLGRRTRGAGLWLALGGALILLHIPYYSPGVADTGPVYYYELLLPASLLGAQALVAALERWPRLTTALLLVHLTLGTTSFLIENVARLGRMVRLVHGPVESVVKKIEPPALLIYESALQESLRVGWLNSGFPQRFRSERDPIVTYPRNDPQAVAALRERYAGRHCWYYRVNPKTLQQELLSCEAAAALLDRPVLLQGPALGLSSTAMRLGLLDPFAAPGHSLN